MPANGVITLGIGASDITYFILTGLGVGELLDIIASLPIIALAMIYYGGEAPDQGAAVSVEYSDGNILWDDDSAILWDTGTNIEWSHHVDINPDVYHTFSTPRTNYAGEAD